MRRLFPNEARYLYSELSSQYSFFIGVWFQLDGKIAGDGLGLPFPPR